MNVSNIDVRSEPSKRANEFYDIYVNDKLVPLIIFGGQLHMLTKMLERLSKRLDRCSHPEEYKIMAITGACKIAQYKRL